MLEKLSNYQCCPGMNNSHLVDIKKPDWDNDNTYPSLLI
jgi:hypothetical protein